MCSQKIEALKLQLKLAMKQKVLHEKRENQLRSIDRSLTEEMSGLNNEIDLTTEQLEQLTKYISEMKYHVVNVKVCNVSEQCKIKLQKENIEEHSNGYKKLYAEDEPALQYLQEKLKAKEKEMEEARKRALEIIEMNNKKVLEIEKECESLESECNILKKRNKAIMLKLRSKLFETYEIKRKMRNKDIQTP